MPYIYNNPLFSINLPSNSIFSFSDLSDTESNNTSITYISPFCPIIKIKKKYDDNYIQKFNYLDNGKKIKRISI